MSYILCDFWGICLFSWLKNYFYNWYYLEKFFVIGYEMLLKGHLAGGCWRVWMIGPRPREAGGRQGPPEMLCTLIRGPWPFSGFGVETWLSGLYLSCREKYVLICVVLGVWIFSDASSRNSPVVLGIHKDTKDFTVFMLQGAACSVLP